MGRPTFPMAVALLVTGAALVPVTAPAAATPAAPPAEAVGDPVDPGPATDPASVPLWQQVTEVVPQSSYRVPVPTDVRYRRSGARQISLDVVAETWVRTDPVAVARVARVAPEARARVRAVAANDGVTGLRERTSSMCRRTACAVAVNGDYWDSGGRPTGLLVSDGELYQSPPPLHAQVLFDAAGTPTSGPLAWTVSLTFAAGPVTVDAVNRAIGPDQLVLYTPRRGATTGTPAGTRELILVAEPGDPATGQPVRIVDQRTSGDVQIGPGRLVLAGSGAAADVVAQLGADAALGDRTGTLTVDLGGARHGVGGSPGLVADGLYAFPYDDPGSATQGRAPRTVVGWTATGELLLVAVDGRRPGYSEGLSYPEAAQLLVTLGAIEGVALDGGGSTTFVVEGRVANRPSDPTGERSVAGALVVGPAAVRADRLAGPDRFATAVAASQALFPGPVDGLTVANGFAFADALAGAPASLTGDGPVLLTGRDDLPAATEAEIRRLAPRVVVVLGGPAAVSPSVEARLRQLGPQVVRVAGDDRYETSARVASLAFPGGAPVAYLATGLDFPDALAAGAGAAREGGPVLLTPPDGLPDAVADELARLRPGRIVVVGGAAAVSEAVVAEAAAIAPVSRVAGADRYDTAAAVARATTTAATDAVVATGLDFPDALSGAWLAGRGAEPLLLVPGSCTAERALAAADRLGVDGVTLVGGPRAVGRAVERLAVCP